jgi:hypothetical protein
LGDFSWKIISSHPESAPNLRSANHAGLRNRDMRARMIRDMRTPRARVDDTRAYTVPIAG